ncbi:MAG: YciI family protein, partial [Muribaculaceae bacterium]|nr:YciI family protein [Muribaculaceae bacterium]
MFIAILTYKKPLEEVDRFLQAHRDFLAEHYAAGDFIASGP